jgi:hypothetical protein
MRRPLARSVLCLGVLLALLGAPRILEAAEPDNVSVARAAYDRGARAFNAGQYVAAAREFSVADELAPNPVALRFALQAVLFLDDPVLGREGAMHPSSIVLSWTREPSSPIESAASP